MPGKQKPLVVRRRIVRRMVDIVLVVNLLKTDVDPAKLILLDAKVKIRIEDPTIHLQEGLLEKKVSRPHSLLAASHHKILLADRMNVSSDGDPVELSVHLVKPLVLSLARRVLRQQVP